MPGADARRLLVVDAYDAAGRSALRAAGASPAGDLYARVLRDVDPSVDVDISRSGERAPRLDGYVGVVWTGSNLTIHKENAEVAAQVELSRAAMGRGIAQFGSCWAAHLAAVVAGGQCAANPRGREFGISRGLTLTEPGARHPLLRGRAAVYEAFTSHEDMVVSLPANAVLLARNDFAEVQALEVRGDRAAFVAVQYHPEYDFHEVACLSRLRREQLVREGRFAGDADAAAFAEDFEALHERADDPVLAERQGVSDDVRDPATRRLEVVNWLASLQ